MAVGLMSYYEKMQNLRGATATGVLAGFAAVVIFTSLNMIFWGGTTGNVWGDAAYAVCLTNEISAWMASTIDEIIVDLPDKIVTIIIVIGMYKSMPKSLLSLY